VSDKRPSRIANLPHAVREHLAGLPDRWQTWREGFRQEPAALWRSPLTQIAVLVAVLVIILIAVTRLVGAIAPPGGDRRVEPATPVATLYVACTNPACRASYTTRQPMSFKAWPLKCEKCGQMTVYRATLCKDCRRWYAVLPGMPAICPFCEEQKHAKAAATQPAKKSAADEDEDSW